MLLYGVAAALVGVAITVTLDGPAVVAAWSLEALVLAWAGRHTSTPERGLVASVVFAGLAAGHVLVFEVPPTSLAYGLDSIPVAIGAVALVLLALAGIAAAYRGRPWSLSRGSAQGSRSIWRAASSSTSPARKPGSRPRRRSSRSLASGRGSASRRSSPGSSGASARSGSAASES